MQIVHIPFTNIIVAANNGAPVRIIGGSGAGGLFLIAQGSRGIKSMDDLAKQKGKGLKIGAMRLNTFELMAYRALANAGLKYDDFQMVWFSDTLSMASAFEAKAVDVVTHVEPFATRLVDKLGGVPIASNLDTWGKDGPDCVTNARIDFLEKYPQAATKYMRRCSRPTRRSRPTRPRRSTCSTPPSSTASTRTRCAPRCRASGRR